MDLLFFSLLLFIDIFMTSNFKEYRISNLKRKQNKSNTI